MKNTITAIVFLLWFWSCSAQIQVGSGQTYPTIYAVCKAKAAKPGDTIYMHGGTYTDKGQVFDSLDGTASKWIVIRPYKNDSVSIHVTYTFQNAQYLKISGLNFYGSDPAQKANVYHLLFIDYAYNCFNANHDIIIENCRFTDLDNSGKNSTGAMLKIDGTDHFQVINCLFKNGINITDGISLNANRNGLVKNCSFENMPGDGSHCKGGSKKITYEKNLFINCSAGGLDIGGDTGPAFFCPPGANWEADSIYVFSNIFIGGKTGIRLSSCHNSLVYNNTCFKSTSFAFRTLNASSNAVYVENNYIYNNIFTTYSTNHIYLNASSSYNYNTQYFKNNLFHDYKNTDPSSINWSEMPGVNVSGSLIGDPLFTDTLKSDFSLKSGSPAIHAGISLTTPLTDYFGKPFQSSRTIGAVEFGVAGFTDEEKTVAELNVYPNPSSSVFSIRWNENEKIQLLTIFDAGSKAVMSFKPSLHEIRIDLSGYYPGLYELVLFAASGTVYTKTLMLIK